MLILRYMKIKKELIGSKVFSSILRQFILIEEGNEKKYFKMGLDVFEKAKKPKLQKNAKNTKKLDNVDSGDGDRIDNVDES